MAGVEFEMLHRSYQVSVSQCRADWFIRWTREVSRADDVHLTKDRLDWGAGVRTAFSRSAVQFRDTLLSSSPRVFQTCSGVRLIHYETPITRTGLLFCFRVKFPGFDAQASDTRTGVGGWYPVPDECGQEKSPWFSLGDYEDGFPWVFSRVCKAILDCLCSGSFGSQSSCRCGRGPGTHGGFLNRHTGFIAQHHTNTHTDNFSCAVTDFSLFVLVILYSYSF